MVGRNAHVCPETDVGSVGAKIFMNNSKIYYAGGVIDWEISEW